MTIRLSDKANQNASGKEPGLCVACGREYSHESDAVPALRAVHEALQLLLDTHCFDEMALLRINASKVTAYDLLIAPLPEHVLVELRAIFRRAVAPEEPA